MAVLFVGLSHATAPVAMIEQLAFTPDDAAALLASITPGDRIPALPLRELVVLSTCHRVELYAVAGDDVTRPAVALDALARVLTARPGATDDNHDIGASIRRLVGTEATRHLLRVAGGLESMVLGESEILGQVSSSLALAVRIGSAGALLTPLFEAAVRTGRRARAETAIGSMPASVSSIAAELAEELADDLRGRRVLFVGGGKIASLTAKALRGHGYWEMSIAAPPNVDAAAVATEFGATAVAAEDVRRALAESDLVLSCSSPPVTIDAAMVQGAMRGRRARPLAFIDLGASAAFDPAIAEMAGVRVVAPNELREKIDLAMAGRRHEMPLVETIVEEELRALQARAEGTSLSGVVAALRARAEEIRQRELARALAALPDADAAVRTQLEWLSVSLVNKLLDEPTRRLRAEAGQGQANPYADVTRELFGLPTERADRPPA